MKIIKTSLGETFEVNKLHYEVYDHKITGKIYIIIDDLDKIKLLPLNYLAILFDLNVEEAANWIHILKTRDLIYINQDKEKRISLNKNYSRVIIEEFYNQRNWICFNNIENKNDLSEIGKKVLNLVHKLDKEDIIEKYVVYNINWNTENQDKLPNLVFTKVFTSLVKDIKENIKENLEKCFKIKINSLEYKLIDEYKIINLLDGTSPYIVKC